MIRSAEEGSFQNSNLPKSRDFRIQTLEGFKYKEEAWLLKTPSPPCTTANFEKSLGRQFFDFLSESYINIFVFLSSFIHKIPRKLRKFGANPFQVSHYLLHIFFLYIYIFIFIYFSEISKTLEK